MADWCVVTHREGPFRDARCGRDMAPEAFDLVSPALYMQRLDRTFELKWSSYKKQKGLFAYVLDGSSRKRSQQPVLLPEASGDRIAQLCAKVGNAVEADFTDVFLNDLRNAVAPVGEPSASIAHTIIAV